MRIAIVGTGYVAPQYARTLIDDGAKLVCYDTDPGRQAAFIAEFGSEQAASLADIAGRDVTVAVNLTPPAAHHAITATLLRAGVPVYSEKPLAATVADALELNAISQEVGVPLACAPDTILGGAQQSLRNAVDGGRIGRPIWIQGQVSWGGHEYWHPRPEFFYRRGGGPLLDLAPYWITAMVNVAGPVAAVSAVSSPVTLTRHWRDQDGIVTDIIPEMATTQALLMRFSSGVIASLLTSYDFPWTAGPALEIAGEEGSLVLREPLFRGCGPVEHRGKSSSEWTPLPALSQTPEWRRGVGVLEFIEAIKRGAQSRLSAEMALHVLRIAEVAESQTEVSSVFVEQGIPRPQPYPGGEELQIPAPGMMPR